MSTIRSQKTRKPVKNHVTGTLRKQNPSWRPSYIVEDTFTQIDRENTTRAELYIKMQELRHCVQVVTVDTFLAQLFPTRKFLHYFQFTRCRTRRHEFSFTWRDFRFYFIQLTSILTSQMLVCYVRKVGEGSAWISASLKTRLAIRLATPITCVKLCNRRLMY